MISSVIDCYWQFDISKDIENDFDSLYQKKNCVPINSVNYIHKDLIPTKCPFSERNQEEAGKFEELLQKRDEEATRSREENERETTVKVALL